jgi:hypothetical protein
MPWADWASRLVICIASANVTSRLLRMMFCCFMVDGILMGDIFYQ